MSRGLACCSVDLKRDSRGPLDGGGWASRISLAIVLLVFSNMAAAFSFSLPSSDSDGTFMATWSGADYVSLFETNSSGTVINTLFSSGDGNGEQELTKLSGTYYYKMNYCNVSGSQSGTTTSCADSTVRKIVVSIPEVEITYSGWSSSTLLEGGYATYFWGTKNAVSCRSGEFGDMATSGSKRYDAPSDVTSSKTIMVSLECKDLSGHSVVSHKSTTIIPVNDAPTISGSTVQINSYEDVSSISGYQYIVSDEETPAVDLNLSVTSSDNTILPASNVSVTTLSGGSIRELSMSPLKDANGTVVLTLTVTDDEGASNKTELPVYFAPKDDAPVLEAIPAATFYMPGSGHTVTYRASDIDSSLLVSDFSFSSSSPSIIDATGIKATYSKSNGGGVIDFTDAILERGTSNITVKLKKNGLEVSRTFSVSVQNISSGTIASQLDTSAVDPEPDFVPNSNYFGALAGDFSVSEDASFSYSVPITIPDGLNGRKPHLSLSYSSSRGNGLLGRGWSLLGLSNISRCKANYLRDGYVGGINAEDNYKYCLNGQRLVEVAVNEYRTEKESFLRITYNESADAWVLVDNSGVTTTLGGDENARTEDGFGNTYTWFQSREEDIFGNHYIVEYYKDTVDSQVHRLDQITYTHYSNGSTGKKVKFVYEDREDVQVSYAAGRKNRTDQRLNKIQVQHDEVVLHEYGLNYRYTGAPARASSMDEITLCFMESGYCAKPLIFDWPSLNDDDYRVAKPYDTDQLNDFLDLQFENGVQAAAYLHLDDDNMIDAYYAEPDPISFKGISLKIGGDQIAHEVEAEFGSFAKYQLIDINGDGFEDVVRTHAHEKGISVFLNESVEGTSNRRIATEPAEQYSVDSSYISATHKIHLNGIGNLQGSPISFSTYKIKPWEKRTTFVDINGDGLLDLFRYSVDCTTFTINCLGDDFGGKVLFNTESGWQKDNETLLFVAAGLLVEGEATISFEDITGDGLPDAIVRKNKKDRAGIVGVSVNKSSGAIGSATFERVSVPSDFNSGKKEYYTGDFNGDGISDVLVNPTGKTYLSAALGNGDGTFDEVFTSAGSLLPSARSYPHVEENLLEGCGGESTDDAQTYSCVKSVIDYNNDGLSDLLVTSGGKPSKRCSINVPDDDGTEPTPVPVATTGEDDTTDPLDTIDGYVYRTIEEYNLDLAMGKITCVDIERNMGVNDPHRGHVFLSMGADATGTVKFADPIDLGIANAGKYTPVNRVYPAVADYNRDGYADLSMIELGSSKLARPYITKFTSADGAIAPILGNIKVSLFSTGIGATYQTGESSLAVTQDKKQGLRRGVTKVKFLRDNLIYKNVSYTFEDAVFQFGGYGDLGFASVTKISTYSGDNYSLIEETRYHQTANSRFNLLSKPKQRRVSYKRGQQESVLLNDTRYLWAVRVFDDDIDTDYPSPHYYPYLYESSDSNVGLIQDTGSGAPVADIRRYGYEPSSYSCSPLEERDLRDIISSERIIETADVHFDDDSGVQYFNATVTCDAADTALASVGLSDANAVVIQASEQSDIDSRGLRRGLVGNNKVYAWTGSSVGAAAKSLFDVRESSSSYNALGLLQTSITQPNSGEDSAQWLSTTLGYNSYGSVSSISKAWQHSALDGLPDTVSTTTIHETWSGGERTVVSTAPLMPSETTVFHEVYGKPVTHTDVNDLTTTWNYDALARETAIFSPGNIVTQYEYQAIGTSGDWRKTGKVTGRGRQVEEYNAQGLVSKRRLYSWDGLYSSKNYNYNYKMQLQRENNWRFDQITPYFPDIIYVYDDLGRLAEVRKSNTGTYYTHYRGRHVQTTNEIGQTQSRYLNAAGWVISSVDNAGVPVDFTYTSFGDIETTMVNSDANTLVSIGYDELGRRTSLIDPNAGARTYTYNGLGLVASETDAENTVTRYGYDLLGRQTQRWDDATGTGRIQNWIYDTQANGMGKLASVSAFSSDGSGYSESYVYNTLSQQQQATRSFGGKSYTVVQHFDDLHRPIALTYPSGFTVAQRYNEHGIVYQKYSVLDGAVLWTAEDANPEGNVTEFTLGNGITTTRAYKPGTGYLTDVQAFTESGRKVQQHSYAYDGIGKLESRTDGRFGVAQDFFYTDGMNRLTDVTGSAGGVSSQSSFSYDSLGNIRNKESVGVFEYGTVNTSQSLDDAGPHAVVAAGTKTYKYDNNGNVTKVFEEGGSLVSSVTYGTMNLPTNITNNGNSVSFVYDVNHSRIKREDSSGKTTLYGILGLYEQVSDGLTTENIHYIDDFAIFVERVGLGAGNSYQYLHRDHIGSVAVRTDENGNDIELQANGAWGERRYQHWEGAYDPDVVPALDSRGFTGHEHLDNVGLIHMNGRVYDPELGRFLSADPFIQAPYNTQSYNRYSYVFNNPLSFTDPSGYKTCDLGRDGRISEKCSDEQTEEDKDKKTEEVMVYGNRDGGGGGIDANSFYGIGGAGYSWGYASAQKESFASYFGERVMSGQVRDDIFDYGIGLAEGGASVVKGLYNFGEQSYRHLSGDTQANLESAVSGEALSLYMTNDMVRSQTNKILFNQAGDLSNYSARNIGHLTGRFITGALGGRYVNTFIGVTAGVGDGTAALNRGGDFVTGFIFGE